MASLDEFWRTIAPALPGAWTRGDEAHSPATATVTGVEDVRQA